MRKSSVILNKFAKTRTSCFNTLDQEDSTNPSRNKRFLH